MLKTEIYRARRDYRHVLLGAALLSFGIGVGYFAHLLSGQRLMPPRLSGYFPATLFFMIGLYIMVQAALRFPRLEIGPRGIAVVGMFTEYRAAWDSVGAFEVDARPFGVFFGNDIVSAQQRSGGRFSVGLRPYDVNAHALMMELNRWRAAAHSSETVAPAQPAV